VHRLTLLHVVAPGDVGGKERVVHALAAGHRDRGHTVHVGVVLDTARDDHPFVELLQGSGVSLTPIWLPARAYVRERRAIAELCRRLQPDVVHTHGYRADVVDSGVARRLGVPTVATVHGFTGGGPKNRLYQLLQLRALRRFAAVVAVSRPLESSLRDAGIDAGRLHLIPNAWYPCAEGLGRAQARSALGVAPHGFRIGWVGRLSREKGADTLLDAVAQLQDISVAASIVGDGPRCPQLRVQARALGLEDRITWHGMVRDAGRLQSAFDVFVLSSRTEGTPISLFEAMAAKVPVVATKVGGVPDVLTESEALLVPSEDDGAIAEAVRSVYCDPEAARHRALAAHQRLRRQFAVEPWLARHETLYETLLGPGRRGT
jgi:glycosyltransferase involved in cell wall biosynthesis